MFAIQQASRILDWQENLPSDETPPEWMWTLDHELEAWFDEVDRKRKERFGIEDDDREAPQMMQNEFAKNRR